MVEFILDTLHWWVITSLTWALRLIAKLPIW